MLSIQLLHQWVVFEGKGAQAIYGVEVWNKKKLADVIFEASFEKSNCVMGIYIRRLDISTKWNV